MFYHYNLLPDCFWKSAVILELLMWIDTWLSFFVSSKPYSSSPKPCQSWSVFIVIVTFKKMFKWDFQAITFSSCRGTFYPKLTVDSFFFHSLKTEFSKSFFSVFPSIPSYFLLDFCFEIFLYIVISEYFCAGWT